MYNSVDEDYLPTSSVKIEYNLDHPNAVIANRVCHSFRWYELEPMGLGPEGKIFINLDRWIDTSNIDAIREEIEEGVQHSIPQLSYLQPFGIIPEWVNGERCLDGYFLNAIKYGLIHDFQNSHASKIKTYHELKRYYIHRFGLTPHWKRIIHLRLPLPFYDKDKPSGWNDCIKYFPLTKKLIESLPFESIGIGLIFRSNEDKHLLIHRDSFHRNHNLHHINISLSRKNRRVFVYDSVNRVKNYLEENCRAYTFNECDLHGADPQWDHLVLRVDGKFQDWFAKELGYQNGVSFDWAYDKPQDFFKRNGHIKITKETDI